jgi:hypothetical protein
VRVRGRGRSLAGGVHLSGDAGVRAAWLGRAGSAGLKRLFLFPGNFQLLFFLFSLGFSIQIQTKFQIQTNSNMCNNSKDI